MVQTGERWLQVQLLGEVDRATGRFNRGVGSYPGLDDPVHFAVPADLVAVYPPPAETNVELGRLASAETVTVCVDAGPMVLRHAAIVGSTGSGKTSAVASLLQGFVRSGWRGANIVVIDPHGEYSRALGESASTRSVLADGEQRLRVPYWALPAEEILRIVTGHRGPEGRTRTSPSWSPPSVEKFAAAAKWLSLDASAITSDTPIPFDINEVWHRLDFVNRETREERTNPESTCVEDHGDAAELKPARFTQYGAGSSPPQKSPQFGSYGNVPDPPPNRPARSETALLPRAQGRPGRDRPAGRDHPGVARRGSAGLRIGLQRCSGGSLGSGHRRSPQPPLRGRCALSGRRPRHRSTKSRAGRAGGGAPLPRGLRGRARSRLRQSNRPRGTQVRHRTDAGHSTPVGAPRDAGARPMRNARGTAPLQLERSGQDPCRAAGHCLGVGGDPAVAAHRRSGCQRRGGRASLAHADPGGPTRSRSPRIPHSSRGEARRRRRMSLLRWPNGERPTRSERRDGSGRLERAVAAVGFEAGDLYVEFRDGGIFTSTTPFPSGFTGT